MKDHELDTKPLDDARAEAVRVGETPRLWFRANRAFQLNGEWYFTTREGIDVGPYATQFDAELEAGLLAQKLKQTPSEEVSEVIRSHALEADMAAGTMNSAAFTDYLEASGGTEILQELAKGMAE